MNKLKENFEEGTSANLPSVDLDMVISFISKTNCFSRAETCNIKSDRSKHHQYGDDAIGYIQILREKHICTVEAVICPEVTCRNDNYTVRVVIDEEHNVVISFVCNVCDASMSGCKHAAALVAWLHRRTEEPACSYITSYWKPPKLFTADTMEYKKISDIVQSGSLAVGSQIADNQNTFLEKILKAGKLDTESHLISFFNTSPLQEMSMHHNAVRYDGDKENSREFLDYVAAKLTDEACTAMCSGTKYLSASYSRYELSYGRITASVIYEAAHCDGSDEILVQKILSGQNIDAMATKRGKLLEPQVLIRVADKLKKKVEKCGLQLNAKFPEFSASPDGICNDGVIEVKYPISEKSTENYYRDGNIRNKFKSQIQLQMVFHDKSKGYFCIADPEFEINGNVIIVEESFDKNFITTMMKRARAFWSRAIFPILMR